MSNDQMSFWEKWYWANFLRGTNPVTTFISGLIRGIWIPIVLSLLFCFFTDPQWRRVEGLSSWSPAGFVAYYCFFWKTVITVCWNTLCEYVGYFVNHTGSIGRFVRSVFWMN